MKQNYNKPMLVVDIRDAADGKEATVAAFKALYPTVDDALRAIRGGADGLITIDSKDDTTTYVVMSVVQVDQVSGGASHVFFSNGEDDFAIEYAAEGGGDTPGGGHA